MLSLRLVGLAASPEAQQFMAGEWYINAHMAANPKGEIRGQVTPPGGENAAELWSRETGAKADAAAGRVGLWLHKRALSHARR